MKKPSLIFVTMLMFIGCSCKKALGPKLDPLLLGKWQWAYSGFGNSNLINSSSGIKKTLIFKNDGSIIIIHNDSVVNNDILRVGLAAQLLTNAVADTATYQIISESAGCVNINYPAISISSNYGIYNYQVTNDTLQITLSPCLGPQATTYIKAN